MYATYVFKTLSDRPGIEIETTKKKYKVFANNSDTARLWAMFIQDLIRKPKKSPSFHGSQSSLCTIGANSEEDAQSTYL